MPHEARAFSLVGFYLQAWAIMEGQLNSALGKALGLNLLAQTAVARNAQLRDKLSMMKAAIHLQHFNEVETTRFTKLMETVANRARDRNMIAHELFYLDAEGDGVKFSIVKAKGKIQFPDTRWSIAKFVEKRDELKSISDDMDALKRRITTINLARAFVFGPTSDTSLLGLFGHPFRQIPDNPYSGLLGATRETEDQTPQAPEE